MFYVGQRVRIHDRDGNDFKRVVKCRTSGVITEVKDKGVYVSFYPTLVSIFCLFENISPVIDRKEDWE